MAYQRPKGPNPRRNRTSRPIPPLIHVGNVDHLPTGRFVVVMLEHSTSAQDFCGLYRPNIADFAREYLGGPRRPPVVFFAPRVGNAYNAENRSRAGKMHNDMRYHDRNDEEREELDDERAEVVANIDRILTHQRCSMVIWMCDIDSHGFNNTAIPLARVAHQRFEANSRYIPHFGYHAAVVDGGIPPHAFNRDFNPNGFYRFNFGMATPGRIEQLARFPRSGQYPFSNREINRQSSLQQLLMGAVAAVDQSDPTQRNFLSVELDDYMRANENSNLIGAEKCIPHIADNWTPRHRGMFQRCVDKRELNNNQLSFTIGEVFGDRHNHLTGSITEKAIRICLDVLNRRAFAPMRGKPEGAALNYTHVEVKEEYFRLYALTPVAIKTANPTLTPFVIPVAFSSGELLNGCQMPYGAIHVQMEAVLRNERPRIYGVLRLAASQEDFMTVGHYFAGQVYYTPMIVAVPVGQRQYEVIFLNARQRVLLQDHFEALGIAVQAFRTQPGRPGGRLRFTMPEEQRDASPYTLFVRRRERCVASAPMPYMFTNAENVLEPQNLDVIQRFAAMATSIHQIFGFDFYPTMNQVLDNFEQVAGLVGAAGIDRHIIDFVDDELVRFM